MDSVAFNILCVDDNADTCELVDIWLKHAPEQYHCHFAKSSEEAMALIDTQHFDVIVLDSWLAGSSGVELCRTIRITDQTTPILFFSGVAIEDAAAEALKAGADGYLTKPCFAEAFVMAVRQFAVNGRGSHISQTAA
jgi:DNA-binding response OmpR family regulator